MPAPGSRLPSHCGGIRARGRTRRRSGRWRGWGQRWPARPGKRRTRRWGTCGGSWGCSSSMAMLPFWPIRCPHSLLKPSIWRALVSLLICLNIFSPQCTVSQPIKCTTSINAYEALTFSQVWLEALTKTKFSAIFEVILACNDICNGIYSVQTIWAS